MIPSKFIAYEERRPGRALTEEEREVVLIAREKCTSGKRDTVKAMRTALEAYWSGSAGERASRSGRSCSSGTG